MRAAFAVLALAFGVFVAPMPEADASTLVGRTADTVGLFDPASAQWYLRTPAGATTIVSFGLPGDLPVVGDWNGDDVDDLGVYRPGSGALITRTMGGEVLYGTSWLTKGGSPVAGDFDGDGVDEIAVLHAGRLLVPWSQPEDRLTLAGLEGPVVVGDWDDDGVDEVAAVTDGRLVGPGVSLTIRQSVPVSGDWDGDGHETIAAFDPWRAEFTLYHGLRDGAWQAFVGYGSFGMIPVAGYFGDVPGEDAAPEHRVGLPPMALGDSGPEVALLQAVLSDLGLYRGSVTGDFDRETSYGVMTLHKVLGLPRDWDLKAGDWRHLANFEWPELPERADEPDRVEVDIGRQVLFVFRDGEIATAVPVSTGGSYIYWSERSQAYVGAGTPRGDFTLFHHAFGWHCDPVTTWCIYSPWSFTPYYAVHGYGSVPEYPASHGCIRVTVTDADHLVRFLEVGMPIHVWDDYPAAAA